MPARQPLNEVEALVLERVACDGGVAVQAPVEDEQRRRRIRRLHNRLAGRDDLEVVGGIGTSTTFLHVRRAGSRPGAFYGELVG